MSIVSRRPEDGLTVVGRELLGGDVGGGGGEMFCDRKLVGRLNIPTGSAGTLFGSSMTLCGMGMSLSYLIQAAVSLVRQETLKQSWAMSTVTLQKSSGRASTIL